MGCVFKMYVCVNLRNMKGGRWGAGRAEECERREKADWILRGEKNEARDKRERWDSK